MTRDEIKGPAEISWPTTGATDERPNPIGGYGVGMIVAGMGEKPEAVVTPGPLAFWDVHPRA